jgi:ribonuclease T2
MFGRSLDRRVRILICFGYLFLIAAIGFGAMVSASAQERRQNTPGQFDFYVLSLSWSPSFCEEVAERGSGGRSQQAQCGGRPFSFVVHGLWPQYEHGYPEYCDRDSWLDRNVMTSMLDLMPAPGLIFNEWKKHGTCSGLAARGYFEAIRRARAAVKIPPEFIEDSLAGRRGRSLHQGQSGPARQRHRGDL